MEIEAKTPWTDGLFLRHLAGRYFLIKKAQTYPHYRKPIEMDEHGAEFWHLLCRYPEDLKEAARLLADEYGIPEQEAAEDLEEFRQTIFKRMDLP